MGSPSPVEASCSQPAQTAAKTPAGTEKLAKRLITEF